MHAQSEPAMKSNGNFLNEVGFEFYTIEADEKILDNYKCLLALI